MVMDHVVMTTESQFLKKTLDVGFQYVKIYVFGVKDSEFGHDFFNLTTLAGKAVIIYVVMTTKG